MSAPAPPLPFEFTVTGVPVSHQSRNRAAVASWQQIVRDAAAALWGTAAPLTRRLRIALTYFHEGETTRLDNDNLLKPIQDALNGLVYADDDQVVDTDIRRASIDQPIIARRASRLLLLGFHAGEPFVHVIIDEAADHTIPLR